MRQNAALCGNGLIHVNNVASGTKLGLQICYIHILHNTIPYFKIFCQKKRRLMDHQNKNQSSSRSVLYFSLTYCFVLQTVPEKQLHKLNKTGDSPLLLHNDLALKVGET